MVFLGEYVLSLTEGGRVVIPKKIRENLKNEMFVLTKGFDTCLAGYDLSDWDKRSNELLSASLLDRENIERKRLVFSGAHHVTIDEQGRFVIPKVLLDFIGEKIGGVTIIGVGDHFEMWSTQKWEEYTQKIVM